MDVSVHGTLGWTGYCLSISFQVTGPVYFLNPNIPIFFLLWDRDLEPGFSRLLPPDLGPQPFLGDLRNVRCWICWLSPGVAGCFTDVQATWNRLVPFGPGKLLAE